MADDAIADLAAAQDDEAATAYKGPELLGFSLLYATNDLDLACRSDVYALAVSIHSIIHSAVFNILFTHSFYSFVHVFFIPTFPESSFHQIHPLP